MEKKRYHTAGRARLLAYLRACAEQPPRSADEIYQGLLELGRAPGRSSVYRMLGSLVERGEVKKFPAESGFLYQYVGAQRGCEGHFHLRCLSCGEVTHLECACSEEVAAHLLGSHGFVVDRGKSVLYGKCAACVAREVG